VTELIIKLTPDHVIPQYGMIIVEYPQQVEFKDWSLSQSLCNSWTNFVSESAVCTIFPANRTMIIKKGF